MKTKLLQIYWHEKQPIYSLSLDKHGRLATSGGDSNIRIWNIVKSEDKQIVNIGYVCTLKKHFKAVNAAKFNPFLAEMVQRRCICVGFTLGLGGMIILWKNVTSTEPIPKEESFGVEASADLLDTEQWSPIGIYRVCDNEDIYDLTWAPNGKHLLIGLTDNTVSIWDMSQGKPLKTLKDHHHFVQGVVWDPFEECFASQSSDRSVKVYQYKFSKTKNMITKCTQTLNRAPFIEPALLSLKNQSEETSAPLRNGKLSYKKLYHDETLVSFFRRLAFTPDGSLLLTPAALLPKLDSIFSSEASENGGVHCVHAYTRASLLSSYAALPLFSFGSFEKPAVVVRPHPFLFHKKELPRDAISGPHLHLSYRMIFAIGTQDSVYFYDTTQFTAFASIKDLHYATITDLVWSGSGLELIVSSVDGFCSIISFEEGELGTPLSPDETMSLLHHYYPKHPQKEPMVESSIINPLEPIIHSSDPTSMGMTFPEDSNTNLTMETLPSDEIQTLNIEISSSYLDQELEKVQIKADLQFLKQDEKVIESDIKKPAKKRIAPTLIQQKPA